MVTVDWVLTGRVFQTVGFYTLGFTIYAALIFFFYKHVSRRLLIEYRAPKIQGWRRFFAHVFYGLEYLLLSPFILFLWGLIIATIIFVLAKGFSAEQALFASMALLATIRVTAYFSEDLATDVAKLVPLSLLAVIAFDAAAIDMAAFWIKVQSLLEPGMVATGFAAFAFIVALELVLRIGYAILDRE
jgi:hypothetical protein